MTELGERARLINDQVWNEDNLAVVDEYFAPGFVGHLPDYPVAHGPAGFKEFVGQVRASFADARQQVQVVIAEGDQVFLRASMRGVHRGPFLGVPPTNLEVRLSEMLWLRFDEQGKVIELWREYNPVLALERFGVVPPETAGPLGRFTHTLKAIGRLALIQAKASMPGGRKR